MQIPLQTIFFKIINRIVVLFVEVVRDFRLKTCYLKKKPELENNNLEGELKCINVDAGSLKSRLISYDNLNYYLR